MVPGADRSASPRPSRASNAPDYFASRKLIEGIPAGETILEVRLGLAATAFAILPEGEERIGRIEFGWTGRGEEGHFSVVATQVRIDAVGWDFDGDSRYGGKRFLYADLSVESLGIVGSSGNWGLALVSGKVKASGFLVAWAASLFALPKLALSGTFAAANACLEIQVDGRWYRVPRPFAC